MLKFIRTLFIFLLTIFTMATITNANTFVVDDDGDPGSTYSTLNSAILTAESFPGVDHEIVIMAGSYSDAGLVISDATKIASIVGDPGEDKANIVFQASTYQAVDFLDLSGTIGLDINNFTVMDYSTAFHGTGVDSLVMTDMVLANNGVDGYVVAADEDGGAVILYDCDDGLFDNLHIFDGERGLRLRGNPDYSDGNTISNCLVENNEQYGIGIGWYGGSDNTITGNTVSGSEDFGLQIRGVGTGNVISDNTVFDCLWEGITVSGPTGTIVSGNTVYGCASDPINPSGANDHTGISYAGIDIEGAGTSATIFGNNSYDNGDGATGFGLYVDGWWCEIYDNCFYGHPGTQAIDNELGGSSNHWHDNYFSDIAVAATSYLVGGGTYSTTDLSPKMRSNTPVAASSTMEVWSTQVVDFAFALPDVCDPADTIDFAAYEFTVSWDPALLSFQGGDNYEFFGSEGLYIFTADDAATGSITFSGVDIANPNIEAGNLGWAEFQAIGVGPATISIGSTYKDVSNVEIPVQSNSLVLTLEDTEAPSISVTANDPITGTDTYSDGSAVGGAVQLFVEGSVSDNFDLSSVWYNIDDQASVTWTHITAVSGTSDVYGALPTDLYIDLTGVVDEGAHQLVVLVVDASGNRDSVYYDFTIDRTGPNVANLAVVDADGCADAGYTNADEVAVSWDNPDGSAVQHEFYTAGWEGALALANPTTYTLNGTEGSHNLYVRQYDVFGNMGAQIGPAAITLDKTAASPNGLTLDGGATVTADITVAVSAALWDVSGGSLYYMLSEDKSAIVCDAANWEDVVSPYVYDFDIADVEGEHWIFRATKDIAGNVSAIDSASIVLDKTAPEFISFAVEDLTGSECSDNWNVNVIVEYGPDAVSAGLYNVASGPYTSFALDGTSPDTILFHIQNDGDGIGNCNDVNTVYGVLVDAAANVGTEVSDEIIVDCGIPSPIVVTVRDLDYSGAFPPHANWSNDAEVSVEVTGLDVDVVELLISETGDFAGEETVMTITSADPFDFNYTHSASVECAASNVYIIARDCAGRVSVVDSDDIIFDLTAPAIADLLVTTENPTDVLTADISMTLTDNCNAYLMKVYEDGYDGAATWVVDAPSATVALADDGDGVRTIFVELADPAGNIVIASTTVEVDQTEPTGTFTINQFGNSLAATGYTSSITDNEIVSISLDADVAQMAFQDPADGTTNTGWIPVTSTVTPFRIEATDGLHSIEMVLMDNAGNVSSWTAGASITLLTVAPPAPATATGTPSASVALSWDAVAVAQMYLVKFNGSGEYPTYDALLTPAPAPNDTVEGLFAYLGPEVSFDFAGPSADIYSFSIWTIDLAGNLSATPNKDVVSTNYILGDMNLDDELTFVDDFGKFSTSYLLSTADAGFLADADFGPTSDNTGTGLPLPDGIIDLEDLIIMGMNYDTYNNAVMEFSPSKLSTQELRIIADIGNYNLQEEFTVTLRTDNSASIKAYNLVLDFDESAAELVSVDAGEMHVNAENEFFHVESDGSSINITGMILGSEFEGEEMVKLTFRTKSGNFQIESKDMIVRDNQNNDIEATFERVGKIIPEDFTLSQNYPNPFNPTTTIEFSLPMETDFSLTIFNITGQKVHQYDGHAPAGKVTVEWDAKDNGSGVYFYKLEASSFSNTKKMVLLK